MSVEVDPIGSSKLVGLVVPETIHRSPSPRSNELSSEAARQIEALVPVGRRALADAVVVSPWRSPRDSAEHGIADGADASEVRIDVTTLVDPSDAARSTVVISESDTAHARPAARLAALRATCARVVGGASPGQTIVLTAPVYIGATRDLLMRPLEDRGLVVGRDVHVAFCPNVSRRLKPGSRPRLVGGGTAECALAAVRSIGSTGPVEVVATPEMAEAAALATFRTSRIGAAIKRMVDITVAAIGLVLIAPIVALVAVAIHLDDGGPVVFTQERIGLNGRPFLIRKFRTMVKGAEGRLDEVAGLNGIRGPAFQIERDPRLTRIGGFLRKSSIDELPQLWNVLYGDMSLVGPRPAPPVEVEAYEPWHRGRLTMRPGITGLAQVRARSYVDFDDKATLDLEYIVRWSPALDFEILLQTIPVVLRLTGR